MELKQTIVKGFFWITLSTIIVQSVQLITKIVLARLLMPQDFGIIAIALVIINAFGLITDFGGGTAIIYFKRRIKDVVNTLFLITSVIGITFFLVTFLSSGLIADFLNEPIITNVMKIFSIVFLLIAPSSVSKALLTKELKFNKIILAEACSVFVYASITILMALGGYGVWSLVFGYVGSVIANTIMLMLLCSWRPKLQFNLKIAGKLVTYGKYVIGANIIAFLVLQGDNAVIGKLINSTALGFYVLAYTIANIPATQIAGIISGVMFPSFSKLQNNFARLKNAYLKTLKMALFFSIPFIFGVTITTNELINYVLGNKWALIKYPLYILLWFGLFRAIVKLTGYLFQAIGKPKIITKIMFYEALGFIVLIFPLTIKLGIVGTSIATTIPMFAASLISIMISKKMLKIRSLEIIKISFPIIISSVTMYLLLFLIKRYIFIVDSLVTFLLLVIFGMIIYISASFLTDKHMLKEIKEIIFLVSK